MLEFSAKGIIWDLDGTLLNAMKIHDDVLSEIFQRRNIAVPRPEIFAANHHEHLRETIRSLTGLGGEELESIYEEFIRAEDHHYARPESLYYADGIDLLKGCHHAGLRQVIISNRSHFSDDRLGSPRNLAGKPPLRDLIDAVVCGDDNEFRKPDPRMLDSIEHKLGLTHSGLIVIGDQFVDAVLAQNLGGQAILVQRNEEVIPHLDRLSEQWSREYLTIVRGLDAVSIHLSETTSV